MAEAAIAAAMATQVDISSLPVFEEIEKEDVVDFLRQPGINLNFHNLEMKKGKNSAFSPEE